MLFAHRCPRCKVMFAAELGTMQQNQVTIRNLCPECEWIKKYVHQRDKTPLFVPLTEKDQPLDKR